MRAVRFAARCGLNFAMSEQRGGAMGRAFPAVMFAALFQVAAAFAAGPFDGQWHGSSQYSGCRGLGTFDLKAADEQATGKAEYKGISASISGAISADGSFNGSIGSGMTMTGKFAGDSFTGTFTSPNCGMANVTLERVKQ